MPSNTVFPSFCRIEVHTFPTASDECRDSWNQMDRAPVQIEVTTGEKTGPSKDCGHEALPTTVSATSPLDNVPIESDPDHREETQTFQQPMDSLAITQGLSEMAEIAKFRHRALPSHLSITGGTAPPSGAQENGNVSSGSRSFGIGLKLLIINLQRDNQ